MRELIVSLIKTIASLSKIIATMLEKIIFVTEMIAEIGYVCKSLNPNDLIRPSDNRLRPGKDCYIRKDNSYKCEAR